MGSPPLMTAGWWKATAALLGLAGLALTYRATQKTVTLVVDGQTVLVRTHAGTVAGALRAAGYDPSPAADVFPEPDARLPSGAPIVFETARPVQLTIDGVNRWLSTSETMPENVLAEAEISLYPGDRLWVDGLLSIVPTEGIHRPARLRLVRGVDFTLRAGGSEIHIRSAGATLGEALWAAGQHMYEGDAYLPGLETPVHAALRAEWTPSRPLTIQVDGGVIATRVAADTVGEALAEAGVSLVGLDTSIPEPDAPLGDTDSVRVVRVREEVRLELEPLPFTVDYQPLADLELDQRRLVDPGAYGVVARRVRVRYEDGVEVSRVAEREWVAQEASPRVVGYGTLMVPRVLDTPDGSITYCRALRMYATSYSPSRAGTPPDAPWYGITRSGKPLRKGLVAIDRSLIPFGTMMYVPGYGFAEAADTGGGVKGAWIDLGYEDDSYVSWHQYVTVYFLCPLPPGLALVFP